MLLIIRIVIEYRHRRKFLKAANQQAFFIKVRKANRAIEGIHPSSLTPLYDFIQEGTTNLFIVDKIKPTKAHFLTVPLLVCYRIDHCRYATYTFTIAPCKKQCIVAKIQCRILTFGQRVELIEVERRAIIRISFIQFIGKLDEDFHLLFSIHLADFNCHKIVIFYLISALFSQNSFKSTCKITFFF